MGGRGKKTAPSSSRRSSDRIKAKSKSTTTIEKVNEDDESSSSSSSSSSVKGEDSLNSSQQLERVFHEIQAKQAAFFEYDEGIDMSEDEYEIEDYSEIRSAPSLDRFLKGSRLDGVRDSIRAMGLDPNASWLGLPPGVTKNGSSSEHNSSGRQSPNSGNGYSASSNMANAVGPTNDTVQNLDSTEVQATTTHTAGPLNDHPLQPNLDSHGIHGQNDQAISVAPTTHVTADGPREENSNKLSLDFNLPSGERVSPPAHVIDSNSAKQAIQSDEHVGHLGQLHDNITHADEENVGHETIALDDNANSNILNDNATGPQAHGFVQAPRVANHASTIEPSDISIAAIHAGQHKDKQVHAPSLHTDPIANVGHANDGDYTVSIANKKLDDALSGGQHVVPNNLIQPSANNMHVEKVNISQSALALTENANSILSIDNVDKNENAEPNEKLRSPTRQLQPYAHMQQIAITHALSNVNANAESQARISNGNSSLPLNNAWAAPGPLSQGVDTNNAALNANQIHNSSEVDHLVGDPFGQNLPAHFNNGLFVNLQNEFPSLQQTFSKPAEAHGSDQFQDNIHANTSFFDQFPPVQQANNHGVKNSATLGHQPIHHTPNFVTNNWQKHFLGELNVSLKLNFFGNFKNKDGRTIAIPPESVFHAGAQHWNSCLIGQFIGKPPPFFLIRRMVDTQWKKFGHVEIQSNESGLFVFRFESQEFCDSVMQELWLVHHHPLLLRRCEIGLQLIKLNCERVPIWLKLRTVPLDLLNNDGLSFVSSTIGLPLQMDSKTASWSHLGYARVCVEMNILKDLPDRTYVELPNGEEAEILIEYDWKPHKCTFCNVTGYDTSNCPNSLDNRVEDKPSGTNSKWNETDKKHRRRRGASRQKEHLVSNNRFNILNSDEAHGDMVIKLMNVPRKIFLSPRL